jgi:glutamate-1-semialdehyde 2,1-aminomutase
MEFQPTLFVPYALVVAALMTLLLRLKSRLELSKAKHWSLAGHGRIAKRLASLIPFYEYDEAKFFCSDSPPEKIAIRRRDGFMRLSAHLS